MLGLKSKQSWKGLKVRGRRNTGGRKKKAYLYWTPAVAARIAFKSAPRSLPSVPFPR